MDNLPLEISKEVDFAYKDWWQLYRGEQFEGKGKNALTYFNTLFKNVQKYLTPEDREYLPDAQAVILHS